MLQRRTKAITSVDLSSETRLELRRQVFEYELSHGLLKVAEIAKKTEEFAPEAGTILEGRAELALAFAGLIVRQPKVFEIKAVPKYLKTIQEHLLKIPSQHLARFHELYHVLETELHVLAALRYYHFDDQGEESSDAEESCERFRTAAYRFVAPLSKPMDSGSSSKLSDLALERNLRVHDIMGIFEGGVFYDDRFGRFMERFNEEEILRSAHQLMVEIQKTIYGMARQPAAHASSRSSSSNGAATKGRLQQSDGDSSQDSYESMGKNGPPAPNAAKPTAPPPPKQARVTVDPDEDSKSTRTTAATSMRPPPNPRSQTHVTSQHEPFQAAAPLSSVSAPARKSQQHQINTTALAGSNRFPAPPRNMALGETQPDASPASSPASVSSRMTDNTAASSSLQMSGRQGRMRFTGEEDEALRQGVTKYGSGKWALILADPSLGPVFRSVKPRTAVNLKDRWRNLEKSLS